MSESLLLLCKTGNGLAHAYVRLDAAQKYENEFFVVVILGIDLIYFKIKYESINMN